MGSYEVMFFYYPKLFIVLAWYPEEGQENEWSRAGTRSILSHFFEEISADISSSARGNSTDRIRSKDVDSISMAKYKLVVARRIFICFSVKNSRIHAWETWDIYNRKHFWFISWIITVSTVTNPTNLKLRSTLRIWLKFVKIE